MKRRQGPFSPVYLVGKQGCIKMNHIAEMRWNLDSTQPDGESYFCKSPKTGNFIHAGLTTLRSGAVVLTREEIFPDSPRSQSWRFSYVVTDDEATDWIILSNNLHLLNKGKFKRLNKKLIKVDKWIPTRKIEDAYWSETESEEIERRLQYVYK